MLIDRLTLSVQNGRVVLTGVVENTALKETAVQSIQGISGIKEVIDAIKVGHPETFNDYSRDAWITTKLWTNLKMDRAVASRNYSVRTVGRTVYLMGQPQSAEELQRVIAHASAIRGVGRIVNYTDLRHCESVLQEGGGFAS